MAYDTAYKSVLEVGNEPRCVVPRRRMSYRVYIDVSVDRVECVHICVGRSCRMCAYMCRSIVSNVCIYVSVDRVECVHICVGRSCRMCT